MCRWNFCHSLGGTYSLSLFVLVYLQLTHLGHYLLTESDSYERTGVYVHMLTSEKKYVHIYLKKDYIFVCPPSNKKANLVRALVWRVPLVPLRLQAFRHQEVRWEDWIMHKKWHKQIWRCYKKLIRLQNLVGSVRTRTRRSECCYWHHMDRKLL